MMISGWGQYPKTEANVFSPRDTPALFSLMRSCHTSIIARGCGRSYGDSALSQHILQTEYLNHFISFDEKTGVLHCFSGTSLQTILKTFVPKGWFLPVTPGTQYVSVGGAIASDVHGKNHHVHGTLCEHIQSIRLAVSDACILECSPLNNSELFHATCGGMGLTGIIIDAHIQLIPIKSTAIHETHIKSDCLDETFELFSENENATYSVAWIDCLAKGKTLGRSIIMLGEHSEQGDLAIKQKPSLNVPFNLPACILNSSTTGMFNKLYYMKERKKIDKRLSPYHTFFYPLDSVQNWNRIYGKQGFVQYQFVIPREQGIEGMKELLGTISNSGKGSFLTVLKAFGPQNKNLLSFPIEGYTLALDFKLSPDLFQFLQKLDKIVLDYGGRIYLSKDARMSESVFKQSYPRWEAFSEIREKYDLTGRFQSLQSTRLGL